MLEAEETEVLEATLDHFGMLELLKNHYGDGSVYLPEGAPTALLSVAIEFGYLSYEGYLTRKGRQFVAEHRLQKIR